MSVMMGSLDLRGSILCFFGLSHKLGGLKALLSD